MIRSIYGLNLPTRTQPPTPSRVDPRLVQQWDYTSGMRYRGFPIGHHMGTDGIDFFVRSTRFLTESLQIGANFNIQERDRSQPVHEQKREAAVDLTWWWSSRTQFTVGYTFQRRRTQAR